MLRRGAASPGFSGFRSGAVVAIACRKRWGPKATLKRNCRLSFPGALLDGVHHLFMLAVYRGELILKLGLCERGLALQTGELRFPAGEPEVLMEPRTRTPRLSARCRDTDGDGWAGSTRGNPP